MLQAWLTYFGAMSSILLCRSFQTLPVWMVILQYFQRCSVGFKSGLELGHSETFTECSRSHSFVILALFLGLLSYWKIILPRSRVLWSRLSSRMPLYIAAFIFPSTLASLTGLAAEKHPHCHASLYGCISQMMSGAWFSPDIRLGIQTKEFNLCLIRPGYLGELSCSGFHLAIMPYRLDWWRAAEIFVERGEASKRPE